MVKKTLLSKILESQENEEPIYCISDRLPYNKTIPKNISGAVVAVKDKDGVVEYLTEETDFVIDVKTGEFKLSEECSDRNHGNVVCIFYSSQISHQDSHTNAPYKYNPLKGYSKRRP